MIKLHCKVNTQIHDKLSSVADHFEIQISILLKMFKKLI